MKKILALVCAFALVFGFASGAFASDLDFIVADTPLSYETEGTIKITLNKPLEFIDDLSVYMNGPDATMGVDFKHLVESLCGTTIKVNTAAQVAPDYLSGKGYVEFSADAPIEFSDNLKIGVGVKQQQWIDYDVTNAEEPKFNMIQTNLLNGKYQFIDLPAMFSVTGDAEEYGAQLFEAFKSAMSTAKDGNVEITTLLKNLLEGKAKVTSDGGKKIIELDDEAIVDVGVDYFCGVMETEYFKNLMTTISKLAEGEGLDSDLKVDDADKAEIKDMIKNLGLFGEDALRLTYEFDENGRIKGADAKIHIDFDIRELLKNAGASEDDINEVFKSGSTAVDMTIECEQEYTSFEANIQMPTLTPDNTIDLAKIIAAELEKAGNPEYTISQPYVPETFYVSYVTAEEIDSKNGDFYVPLDEAMYELRYDYGYDASDDLDYSLTIDEDGNIELVYESDYLPETVLKAKLGETAYTINGEAKTAKYPFKNFDHVYSEEDDGDIAVSVDVLKEMLGCEVTNAEFDIYYGGEEPEERWFINMERPNPGYVAESAGELAQTYPDSFLPEATADAAFGVIGGADGLTAIFISE